MYTDRKGSRKGTGTIISLSYHYHDILGITARFEEEFSTKKFMYISGAYFLAYIYYIFHYSKVIKESHDGDKDMGTSEALLHIRYSTIGLIIVIVGIVIHFLLL